MAPFLFLVGCARSGTTMLRLMFDAHPDIAIARESDFIPQFAGRFAVLPGEDFPTDAFVDMVLAQPKIHRWGLDVPALRRHFGDRPPSTYPDAVRTLYRFLAERVGKQRYGDKTPLYVRRIDALAFIFPEARFIHIIRDGRDVARSMVTTDIGPDRIKPAIRLWRTTVEQGRASGERLGAGRYTEVFYERLTESPEQELRRLAAFAGLDYAGDMIRYHETAVAGRNHPDLASPPIPNLRDWRTQLTVAEIATCHAVAGDLLRDLGYDAVESG